MSVKLLEKQTKRLLLRPSQRDLVQAVLDFSLRNRTFLRQWEPLKTDVYYTEKHHRHMLASDVKGWKQGHTCRWWLSPHTQPTWIIGMVKLDHMIRGAFLSCYLGYSMDQAWCNQGYATEALQAAIMCAFDELELHRIEANVLPYNAPSLRVLEKLGFESEGLAIKYLKINGRWEDHIHMVLRNRHME